jgi:hypothetical protein
VNDSGCDWYLYLVGECMCVSPGVASIASADSEVGKEKCIESVLASLGTRRSPSSSSVLRCPPISLHIPVVPGTKLSIFASSPLRVGVRWHPRFPISSARSRYCETWRELAEASESFKVARNDRDKGQLWRAPAS